jgi:hypothetical protein
VKWGIEHLKVTLRDDTGETVVIEQSKDGAIRCEQANGARRKAAAEPAATRREPDTASPAASPAPAREEPKPRAKSRRHGPRGSGKKEAREARPDAARARPRSLDWNPTKDGTAWGILAKSGSGQFKILRNATSVWSLFYERLDAEGNRVADAKLLGCFPIDAEHKARAKAQEHHDRGTHIAADTTEIVYDLCPAPTLGSPEAGRTRRVRSPKPPVEAETAAPAGAAEPEIDAAKDAAIMGGLDAIIKQHLSQS